MPESQEQIKNNVRRAVAEIRALEAEIALMAAGGEALAALKLKMADAGRRLLENSQQIKYVSSKLANSGQETN
jgi:hypothetical protein